MAPDHLGDPSDVVAPDGSPVAVYRALPRPAEIELVDAAIPRGARILDLGSGTGRFAVPLADLGHRVVAVDHEAAMLADLADVPGITPVVADIDGLGLPQRFDVVLLTAHLIDDDGLGPPALAVARAHLAPAGVVIVESYPPGIDWKGSVGRRRQIGPVGITIRRAAIVGDQLDAEIRYDLDGRTWDQAFVARLLDRAGIDARLAAAGLRLERWLDQPRGWFVAVGG